MSKMILRFNYLKKNIKNQLFLPLTMTTTIIDEIMFDNSLNEFFFLLQINIYNFEIIMNVYRKYLSYICRRVT